MKKGPCASLELMSEEEDGVLAVWIVSPPPGRDRELSALCQVLQERKQRDRVPLSTTKLLIFSSLKQSLNGYDVQFGRGTAAVTFSYRY